MSGRAPQCSRANHRPVRPKPLKISSSISKMPCSSHSARARGQKSAGGICMPLVPVKPSSRIAATVLGSSAASSDSRLRTHADGVPGGHGYGSSMWKAGARSRAKGSLRASPATPSTARVAPWYELRRVMILLRPVTIRAILIAFSTASLPPVARNAFSRPVTRCSRAPSSARIGSTTLGAAVAWSRIWAIIRSCTCGCPWPTLTL